MPFPKTETDLVKAGYHYVGMGHCKGCGASIEWWDTPKNKSIPLDEGSHEAHWATCPKADQFRTKGKRS